jgi:protein SCO1/2
MQGEVVSVDPSAHTATVKHGKIEGWMEAMTMEYPVKDKQQFAKLKAGEKIRAEVEVQGTDYWIANVTPDASQ